MKNLKMVAPVAAVLLLATSIVGTGLGCAAPTTPTSTLTPTVTPALTPGVTPTEVAPGIKSMRIRFAQTYRLNFSSGASVEKFKALLEERSGGKIKVDHYPAGQLFAQADEYHAVGTGAVEMVMGATNVLASVQNPAWDLFLAGPRYFKDLKAINDFWAEPAGGGYFKSLLAKDNVVSLGNPLTASFLNGVVVNNKRPIKKVEDWKGLKMSTGVGQEWEIASFGCNPIPLPNAEVITALQTGMVDGRAVTK